MKVTVHYWAQVKQAAGMATESVEIDRACTAQELLSELADRHGDPLRAYLLDPDGAPRNNLLLILGDRHVNWEEPQPLEDGDELTILPPVSGGRI